MSINEQAVIAGAKAMDAYWGGRYAPDEVEELRGEVTAILEAAAPIIRAEALEGAADDYHRREIRPDVHAMAAIDFLRARAAAERGEG